MKRLFLMLQVTALLTSSAFANLENEYDYDGEAIDITAQKQNDFKDEELEFFEKELGNIKNLKTGFAKKGVVLDELNTEAQGLDQKHREYTKKKLEYNSYIDRYKNQQTCLKKTGSVDKCFKTQTDNFLAQFNLIMQKHSGVFQKCYQAGLDKNDTKTTGNVDFRFRFLPSGHIEHIDVAEKLSKPDRGLLRCIYAKIGHIKFPKTGKSEKIVVGKKFNFNLRERNTI